MHQSSREGESDSHDWSSKIASDSATTPMVVNGLAISQGIVVATTDNGPAVALAANTGKRVWSTLGTGGVGSGFPPVVADGLVFVGQWNTLRALGLEDGEEVWNVTLPDFEIEPGYVVEQLPAQPAVAEGQVVFGTSSPMVYNRDVTSGTLNWQTRVSSDDTDTSAGVVVAEQNVLVSTVGGRPLYNLDLSDGAVRWEISESAFIPPPGIEGQIAVVQRAGFLWNLAALSLETGMEIWNETMDNDATHPPVVANGRAFVYNVGGQVRAYSTGDGALIWHARPGNFTGCPPGGLCGLESPGPAYAGDRLYVSGLDGNVYAINATNGEPFGTIQLGATHLTSPIIAGATMYVGADDQVLAIPLAKFDQR